MNINNPFVPPYALWYFWLAAAGWLIGPIIGFYFARKSQKDARRRAFRDIAKLIHEQTRHAPENNVGEVHRTTSATLTTEALKITEDIHCWNRHRFEKAWRAYCDPANKDFSKTDEWHADAAKLPDSGSDYKLVREQLLRELQLIVKYAA
jgi:hypothetical protein